MERLARAMRRDARDSKVRSRHVALLLLALCSLFGAAGAQRKEPVIGLITKTDTNPFFVKMKEGAEAAAKAGGAKLVAAAGKGDGDNATQVTAMENMVAAGAKVILITVNDAKANAAAPE